MHIKIIYDFWLFLINSQNTRPYQPFTPGTIFGRIDDDKYIQNFH